jgi:hypothetical protein
MRIFQQALTVFNLMNPSDEVDKGNIPLLKAIAEILLVHCLERCAYDA